ncbi:hypothetical protein QP185_14855 [Sphingomonas aerolata]
MTKNMSTPDAPDVVSQSGLNFPIAPRLLQRVMDDDGQRRDRTQHLYAV